LEVIAFFDASALIYLVEGAEPFAGRVRSALAQLTTRHPRMGAAVSRLSWLECRVRPARNNELATLAKFDAFFARPDLVWVELSKNVVELATAIRVRYGLRTPDALQAASCLQLGPRHLFLTGDIAFKKVAELNTKKLG
jgi:predicted nucleic acid-binding protein